MQQTRGGTTQTRTFNYMSGGNVTPFLQSATNPENGTVGYTWNSDGTLATKTDGTITPAYTYAYDSGGWGGTNQAGRLATISYRAAAGDQVVETYGYTAAGLPSGKDLWVTRSGSQAHKTLSYTYDNEGRRTSMTTPIRTFNHSYDAMERATGMTDTGGVTYVSGCRSPELNRDESAQCRGMLLTDSGAGQPNGARA